MQVLHLGVLPATPGEPIILKNMVTTQQTKVALRMEEIAKRVIYASLDETEVRHLLGLLQAQRVIRGLEDGKYELAHDVLAEKIWAWMDPMDLARLNAAQTLREAMSDYKKHQYLILQRRVALMC